MSMNMNRRAVLAGAATIAATSTALGSTEPNADVELLALGAQLEPIIQEWQTERARDAYWTAAWEAECIRAGLPQRDDFDNKEAWRQYHAKRAKVRVENVPEPEEDEHGCSVVWNSIHDRMDELIDTILARRAQTLAGLAVQARAITVSEPEMWTDPDGCFHVNTKDFIDAVCAFLGVTPVPLEKMTAAT